MPLKLKQRGAKKIYWIVGSLLGESVRESARSSDRTFAEQLLIKRTKEIQERYLHGSIATRTFAEAVEYYLDYCPPKTRKEAVRLQKLVDYWGKFKCNEITPEALMEYRRKTFRPGVTNATVKRALYTPLRAVLNVAAQNGFCSPVMLPKLKVERKRVFAAAEEDIARLMAASMPTWLKAALLTLTYHGTRPGDLQRLAWREVNFTLNQLTFRKTKNGKTHSVVMHPEVREAYLAWFQKADLSGGRDQPVFPNIQGNEPASQINNYLRRICKRNDIPYASTHRIGRHAFAERILAAGHTLKELKESGNWESYPAVEYYAHLEKSKVSTIATSMKIQGVPETQNLAQEKVSRLHNMHKT